MDISLLPNISLANISFHSEACLLTFLIASLKYKSFQIDDVQFIYTFFCHLGFWCHIWEVTDQWKLTIYPFSSKSFMVSAVMVRPVINFELHFLYMLSGRVQFHSLACDYPFVYHLLKTILSLIKNQLTINARVCFWTLLSIWCIHICLDSLHFHLSVFAKKKKVAENFMHLICRLIWGILPS